MDSESYVAALAVAVVVMGIVQGLFAIWLKRGVDRRLDAIAGLGGDRHARTGGADRFAEVAPELVTLARTATGAALRKEELDEWHRPAVDAIADDDIGDTIRDNLRRAAFNATAARSALQLATRRHRAAIPDALDAQIRAFCDRLDDAPAGTPAERKRQLATDLDELERRFRDAMRAAHVEAIDAQAPVAGPPAG